MDTIFFDLDGTLTDSGLGITRSVAYAIDKLGQKPLDQKTLELFIGPPLLDSYMKFVGLSKKEAQKGIELYREYYAVTGIYENALYPEVKELLEKLKNQNCRIFLTTSKPKFYAEQILKHFEIDAYFDGVYGATMDEKLSEKEYIIKDALTNALPKVNPQTTLMVGDREYDILGAKANGLKSVGVLYGFGSQEELEQAGADVLIETPLELLKHI